MTATYRHSTAHLEIAAAVRRVAHCMAGNQTANRAATYARRVWREGPYPTDGAAAMQALAPLTERQGFHDRGASIALEVTSIAEPDPDPRAEFLALDQTGRHAAICEFIAARAELGRRTSADDVAERFQIAFETTRRHMLEMRHAGLINLKRKTTLRDANYTIAI